MKDKEGEKGEDWVITAIFTTNIFVYQTITVIVYTIR